MLRGVLNDWSLNRFFTGEQFPRSTLPPRDRHLRPVQSLLISEASAANHLAARGKLVLHCRGGRNNKQRGRTSGWRRSRTEAEQLVAAYKVSGFSCTVHSSKAAQSRFGSLVGGIR